MIVRRDATAAERLLYKRKQPGVYKRFESFIIKLLFVSLVGLAPALIYNHYSPVSSRFQAAYSIIGLLVAVGITYWITVKFNTRDNLDAVNIEVIHVKTGRAVKREDPEDYGLAYYIDVTHEGNRATLYLWGQYLDELDEDQFPNTEFEFVRVDGSEEFLDFRLLGSYFKEEKTLPALGKDVWKSGNYPMNGELLKVGIETIN